MGGRFIIKEHRGHNKRIMTQRLKKGNRVVTTGYGKTKNWGNVVGKVTHRRGEKVFVLWEGTSFPIEDEMHVDEVRIYTSDSQ